MARPRLLVVGMDGHHAPTLAEICRARGVTLTRLFDVAEVRRTATYDVDALLDRAERAYTAAEKVAGIACYWDMPSSYLAATLAERHGLATPGVQAVTTVEHKYWSRCVQQEVVPEVTPAFALVDPRQPDAADHVDLAFPFWLKPVKSASGHLAIRIEDREQLEQAIRRLRQGTSQLGPAFQRIVDRLTLPTSIANAPASAAIAEELLVGDQVTLEGYALDGEVVVYGCFDIHREANGCTFASYTYPSQLSSMVRARMEQAARTLMSKLRWDHGAFNIEFFHDPATGSIRLLEVNPRISQEHAHLMRWVDGVSNLELMVDLALGRQPSLHHPRHRDRFPVAAKFFLRAYEDGVVGGVPSFEVVDAIERDHDPCRIVLLVGEGDRLAHLRCQEPYSYAVAYVYLAGSDHADLERRYESVVHALGLRILPVDTSTGGRPRTIDATRRATLELLP